MHSPLSILISLLITPATAHILSLVACHTKDLCFFLQPGHVCSPSDRVYSPLVHVCSPLIHVCNLLDYDCILLVRVYSPLVRDSVRGNQDYILSSSAASAVLSCHRKFDFDSLYYYSICSLRSFFFIPFF